MPRMSHVLGERAIGMLTAVMSTKAVARKFNLQCRTENLEVYPTGLTTADHVSPTPAQDLHIQRLHLQGRLRPTTRTADALVGLHNPRICAQTVRNKTFVCIENRRSFIAMH